MGRRTRGDVTVAKVLSFEFSPFIRPRARPDKARKINGKQIGRLCFLI